MKRHDETQTEFTIRLIRAEDWEEGAKAGHHSPLTWFALRQCNPHSDPSPAASSEGSAS